LIKVKLGEQTLRGWQMSGLRLPAESECFVAPAVAYHFKADAASKGGTWNSTISCAATCIDGSGGREKENRARL